jgi:Flagellar biogenesis protein
MQQFLDALGLIIIFGSVIFLAYVTTRFVGKSTAKKMKGKNLEVVETLRLSVDKQLYIVRAGDKHIVLSSAGKSIQYLCDINMDENFVPEEAETTETGISEFKGLLDKYLSTIKPQQSTFPKKYIKTSNPNNRKANQTNFAGNIQKLHNLNGKIDSGDLGHDK